MNFHANVQIEEVELIRLEGHKSLGFIEGYFDGEFVLEVRSESICERKLMYLLTKCSDQDDENSKEFIVVIHHII